MNNEEVKKEWENKIRTTFQDSKALIDFMIHTLDNFAYRYLSNTKMDVTENIFMLEGYEDNMGNALKTSLPEVKEAVKLMAKTIPRENNPRIVSRVKIEIHELTADKGKMVISSQINWAYPDYQWREERKVEKKKTFQWDDLQVFRKGFPLALQDVCDLFL